MSCATGQTCLATTDQPSKECTSMFETREQSRRKNSKCYTSKHINYRNIPLYVFLRLNDIISSKFFSTTCPLSKSDIFEWPGGLH